jgi:hypothetical protein
MPELDAGGGVWTLGCGQIRFYSAESLRLLVDSGGLGDFNDFQTRIAQALSNGFLKTSVQIDRQRIPILVEVRM